MVTGADLLAALKVASLRTVEVACQTVRVRGRTGAERKLLQDRAKSGDPVLPHELVGLAAVNPDGGQLFTAEEAAQLADVDGAAVEKIAEAILRASALLPEAEGAAAKN